MIRILVFILLIIATLWFGALFETALPFVGVLVIGPLILWLNKMSKMSEEVRITVQNYKDELEETIKNRKKISYNSFLHMAIIIDASRAWYEFKEYEQLINMDLLYGNINSSYYFNSVETRGVAEYNKILLGALNKYAIRNNFKDYNIVDITRTSNKNLPVGVYLYKFDESDNLFLLKMPLSTITETQENKTYYYYNSTEKRDLVIIDKDSIRDFQYFGIQLMQSTSRVSNNNPPIVSTMISELFFGSSLTILKGINKISPTTSHSINDLRTVQVILNDKTDLEFKGISIYYDFNRIFGKVKNKEVKDNGKDNSLEKGISNVKSTDNIRKPESNKNGGYKYIEELRELKLLLDENIITDKEFEIRKERILSMETIN